MRINKLLYFVFFVSVFASCKKEDFDINEANNINGLGGDTWVKGPIDNWIYDTLTLPYNISVKYKWDQWEDLSDITKIIVPFEKKFTGFSNVRIDPGFSRGT